MSDDLEIGIKSLQNAVFKINKAIDNLSSRNQVAELRTKSMKVNRVFDITSSFNVSSDDIKDEIKALLEIAESKLDNNNMLLQDINLEISKREDKLRYLKLRRERFEMSASSNAF
ncbi:hypothetical protein CANCADRAFT_46279 [Tortispora caseinolytica NRRL Y-17796]|uniref:Uncharacterized protein n=1 Tax=Tortispora caseinolytica NRRL Y-17796 TaxID=767744 RepID=A0A1E4T9G1_9ASCO|nr:hypothetical protein CANCADRAFT_46279 [Tortispora caseinolytica NRRL Y-17796]